VLLGLPGAGKGTQAALLAAAAGVPHIATGNIFRQAVAESAPLGLQVRAILESGGLVPDELTIAIVEERLLRADCRAGFVLDGFPRTVAQGEALDALLQRAGTPLQRAVLLEISEERVVDRISGRRACTQCGATYHVEADPPAPGDLCRRCGQPVLQRPDDRPEVQRSRVAAYRRDTAPLLQYYGRHGRLLRVDGDRPLSDVTAELQQRLSGASEGGSAG